MFCSDRHAVLMTSFAVCAVCDSALLFGHTDILHRDTTVRALLVGFRGLYGTEKCLVERMTEASRFTVHPFRPLVTRLAERAERARSMKGLKRGVFKCATSPTARGFIAQHST